jgi:hypothetical protein
LVLQKDGRVCRDPTQSDTPSDSDNDLAVPFADDLTEEDEEQDSDFCSLLVVSLKNPTEKTRYDVRNVLFLVCILVLAYFLYFVTILCVFCVNYSPPNIRNTCVPKSGEMKLLQK